MAGMLVGSLPRTAEHTLSLPFTLQALMSLHGAILESSSTEPSFPTDSANSVPLAVVPLDGDSGSLVHPFVHVTD